MSQIFLVEKKDGGQRPVINLKGLNQFVKAKYFKIEGLHLLPDLLESQDWDLKDAHLQVPIHPDYQQLLAFQWEEKTYRFHCLPFDLSAAPRVFTELLKPVVGFLRQIGCRLIIYLDNLLMMHQDRAQLEQITQVTCQLFEILGLIVNQKKSTGRNFEQVPHNPLIKPSQQKGPGMVTNPYNSSIGSTGVPTRPINNSPPIRAGGQC